MRAAARPGRRTGSARTRPRTGGEDRALTEHHQNRRAVLRAGAAVAALGTAAIGGSTRVAAAGTGADGGSALRAGIDAVLRRAVDAREVPGVVAMAATEQGVFYEGAFGTRHLSTGPAMTTDTVFRIASMTKAVTSVAAMQLVEEGRLSLDAPVPDIGEPALNAPHVLEGFDASGKPILRPAKRPITLEHLLTHTAGFTYDWSNPNTRRYVEETGMPVTATGQRAALRQPLAFDPGERWEYGINIDWIGLLIEAATGKKLDAVLRERIFTPLGMRDTGFLTTPEQRARQALVHQKHPDGRLEPQPLPEQFVPEFWAGGGGL